MKGISLIVVIIALCAMHATCVPLHALKATAECDAKCWEDKYHAQKKELDAANVKLGVFEHRKERRHLNRELCTNSFLR